MTIDKYGSIDINVINVNSYGSSPWTGASNVAHWILDNGIVGGGLGSSTSASYGIFSPDAYSAVFAYYANSGGYVGSGISVWDVSYGNESIRHLSGILILPAQAKV